MPILPIHVHAVNFWGHGKIRRVGLTITGCLLKGAGGVAIRSKRGDISVTTGITSGHHLAAALCRSLFFL